MSSTERLRAATTEVLRTFIELQRELGLVEPTVKASTLLLLQQQLDGLLVLDRELRGGAPSRRAWSFGQAGAPVLDIVLQTVRREQVELSNASLVSLCDGALSEFRTALIASAEGR